MNFDKVELRRLDAPSPDAIHRAEGLGYAEPWDDVGGCWIVDCIDLPSVFGSGRQPEEAKEAAVFACAAVLDEMMRLGVDSRGHALASIG